MFITLHCGGMPFNGKTIEDKSLGGSETAAYYLAKDLSRLGHKVTLFTNEKEGGEWDGVRYQWAGNITEQKPLGDQFTFYAENTPIDILVIQRHPEAWRHDWMAKVRLWWVHDLALMRNRHNVGNSLWNCDGVMTVSEYHKEQVCSVYNIDPDKVHVLRNGVDLDLFEKAEKLDLPDDQFKMVYSSRPERGLEHHVRPGGIMERLLDTNAHLYVCMYDNCAPQMRDYYQWLWNRCEELPNVTNIGCLDKSKLAMLMKTADALVYPTEFEEVSCITAMEAAAAGLPFIASQYGALPETCEGGGALLFGLKGGKADEDLFVETINSLTHDKKRLDKLSKKQKRKAEEYSWDGRGEDLINVFRTIQESVANVTNIARHFMKMSDLYALDYLLSNTERENLILQGIRCELRECYQFMKGADWQDHYDAYYQHEEDKGVNYGPENPAGQTRYEYVLSIVKQLPAGSRILDYGCAHGHYTNNFAMQCPDKEFIGIDISQSNVDKANAWAPDNARFYCGKLAGPDLTLSLANDSDRDVIDDGFHFVLAAEVIEHVPRAVDHVDRLCGLLRPGGLFMATTPYGPWESGGYRREWPWRAHVHHFERGDLLDMFGHHPEYNVTVAPFSGGHEGKGSYIWSFRKPEEPSLPINMNRKIRETVPRETVSACMIVKDAEGSIRDTLLNIRDVVDEVCICVDDGTKDDTVNAILRFADESHNYPVVRVERIKSPVDIGFDEARNQSISMACSDWILWVDADEKFSYPERLVKYLRHNQYDGYAVKQHHISAEPLGVMKTDIPVRLFRNRKGIRFYGRVHEHPEREMNEGVGRVMMIHDCDIMHSGYTNESVRRARFWRNIPLMVRDREDYPERTLGKFLWLRDLCQMCQYELESNGGRMTDGIQQRIDQGIETFLSLVEHGEIRYVLDALPFYSPLVRLTGKGFNASFAVAIDHYGQVDDNRLSIHNGTFLNREHFEKVSRLLYDTALAESETAYL